jgi:cation:H+ antiporter
LTGLAFLIAGAELVVRGATRLAVSLGVQPLVLGITVVAVGTSAPELAVGITASWQGNGGLAVGNIAGTNVFNVLFILGLSAMLKPLPLHGQILKLELPVTLGAAAMMMGLALDGTLSRLDGLILCAAGVIYTITLVRVSRRETPAGNAAAGDEVAEVDEVFDVDVILRVRRLARTRPGYIAILGLGIVLSVVGANWLVDGSVSVARTFGVSDAIIGLTIVAVGTSAPELVTTIISTIKGDRDVAVGNLLGSSIYNIVAILGLTSLAAPDGLPVAPELLLIDIPLMLCVALACVPVFISGRQISRLEGGIGVATYLGYMAWLVFIRA